MKIGRRSGVYKSVLLLFSAVLILGCWLGPTAEAAPSWSAPVKIYTPQTPGFGLIGLSCPTETFCAAIDNENDAMIYKNGSWESQVNITGTTGIEPRTISCLSSSFCIVTDTSSRATTYDGSSWSTPVKVDNKGTITELSCIIQELCMAVDNKGYAVRYNDGSWSSSVAIDTGRLSSVSCGSRSFCVAGSETGDVITWNDGSWSAPNTIFGPSGYLLGMSCGSPSLCATVTNQGYAMTFNGSSWSSPLNIDAADLYSVDCPSPSQTFCAAVGFGKNALTYNGSSWKKFTDVDDNGDIRAVSCPSISQCVAVDFAGNALTYTGEPPPTPLGAPTITGTTVEGQTLTVVHGKWLGDPYEYSYQWQRCNDSGGDCQAIAGAVSSTYLLTASDFRHTLVVTETAYNANGEGRSLSSPTEIIQAALGPKKETKQPNGGTKESHGTPPIVQCIVPNLRGKSLLQAGNKLIRAHCRLGKVSFRKKHGKHRRHKLAVVSQKPGTGTILPNGTKVAVKLG